MCLTPIKIRNKSLTFGYDSYQKLYMEVPCGHCAECRELMRSQWYLRNYWQCRLSYDTGGYVLFDTLTYADEHLPHLLNFLPEQFSSGQLQNINYPCFSFVDVRNFLKRLRTNLTRQGYDVRNTLKYFIASEYGTDDNYTHRPHYHILLYYIPNGDKFLEPLDLSHWINVSWTYGRTDGVDWKGSSYVLEKNVFGQGYSKNTDVNLRAVACYVAKYVTKDSTFQNTIDSRIEIAMNKLVGDSWKKNFVSFKEFRKVYEEREFDPGFLEFDIDEKCNGCKSIDCWFIYKSIYADYEAINVSSERTIFVKQKYVELFKQVHRAVSQFHRQSQGFGMYGLDPRNFNLDEVVESGVMRIPDNLQVKKDIPIPMYYSRKLFSVKVTDENGKQYWIPSELGKRYRSVRTYTSVQRSVLRFENWYQNLSMDDKTFVDDMLGDRDFVDLSTYMVFFRGRIIGENDELKYTFDTDYIINQLNEFDPVSKEFKYSIVDNNVYINDTHYYMDLKEFCEMKVINDRYFTDMVFEGFDQLLVFYKDTIKVQNEEKQEVYEFKENLKELNKGMRNSLRKLLGN